jgi:uncharacterized protein (TIGR02466 family)
MDAAIEEWFPAQVLIADASHLIDDGKAMFEATDFDAFVSPQYDNGSTTFHRGVGLPVVEGRDWSVFTESLSNAVRALAQKQGVDTKTFGVHLQNIWLSRMWKGGWHRRHAHGGSHYSGTLYINTPDGCGSLRIHNPCADFWGLALPPFGKDGLPSSSMYVDYQPRPGLLLVWNSWLYHEVLPSEADSDRDAISFNFVIV